MRKLLKFPFANLYFLLIRYCANNKIQHLARTVSPVLLRAFASQFDAAVEANLSEYFKTKLQTETTISDIDPHLPLDYNAFVALAKYQLRESKDTGGLDLPSTVKMLEPAFYAASLRHLNVLVTVLPPGTPLFCYNESSFLFSNAFHSAHNRLMCYGALEDSADPPPPPRPPVSTSSSSQPPLSNPPPVPAPFLIPKLDLVASLTPLMLQVTLKKTLPQAMNQRHITKWFQSKHQDVAQVSYIRRINPSLLARANHLAKLEVPGPHGRFDLPSSLVIKYTPNSVCIQASHLALMVCLLINCLSFFISYLDFQCRTMTLANVALPLTFLVIISLIVVNMLVLLSIKDMIFASRLSRMK